MSALRMLSIPASAALMQNVVRSPNEALEFAYIKTANGDLGCNRGLLRTIFEKARILIESGPQSANLWAARCYGPVGPPGPENGYPDFHRMSAPACKYTFSGSPHSWKYQDRPLMRNAINAPSPSFFFRQSNTDRIGSYSSFLNNRQHEKDVLVSPAGRLRP